MKRGRSLAMMCCRLMMLNRPAWRWRRWKGDGMTLWSSADAVAATGGRATRDFAATGVSIDTRTLQPGGDLFVALRDVRDGHDFVAQALAKGGAAAALVSHVPEGVAEDAPLLIVGDVLTALEALGGRTARARSKAKVVAVTGSVGKTSTKEMLRTVLERQGRTHAAEASYNNQWGCAADVGADARRYGICGDRDRNEPPRRDRTAGPNGAPACGDDHHGGPGAYGGV